MNSPVYRARRWRRGFTLIELLCVMSILSLLATMLFPVLATARGKARSAVCASNLRQAGLGIAMYSQDYDGFYPHAVDPIDRAAPWQWGHFPEFEREIPRIGLLQNVLRPYVKSPQVWACLSDTGFVRPDFMPVTMDATPTSFEKYGTSFYYRTELAARRAMDSSLAFPARTNVLFDSVGDWHATSSGYKRYNVLFGDGHVKNVSHEDITEAWHTPLAAR